MQDALHEADELVLEYILFRGFTDTYRTFGAERKQDKTRQFNVDRLLEQLQSCTAAHDAAGLLDLWGFLKTTFFSHLDEVEAATVSQTENDLKRNFIVAAIMDNQAEKAVSFLQLQADSLARDPRWREWFSLPFLTNPSADPHFSVYFQREWRDLFNASLRNFLSSTLRKTPMPKLLAFELSRMRHNADRCALASKSAEALQLTERVRELEGAVDHHRRRNHELIAHLRGHLVGVAAAGSALADAAKTASGDSALDSVSPRQLASRFDDAASGASARVGGGTPIPDSLALPTPSSRSSSGGGSGKGATSVGTTSAGTTSARRSGGGDAGAGASSAPSSGSSGGGSSRSDATPGAESLLVEMGSPSGGAPPLPRARGDSQGAAGAASRNAGFTVRASDVLRSHRAVITRCAFSGDGRYLASADAGAALCVWVVRDATRRASAAQSPARRRLSSDGYESIVASAVRRRVRSSAPLPPLRRVLLQRPPLTPAPSRSPSRVSSHAALAPPSASHALCPRAAALYSPLEQATNAAAAADAAAAATTLHATVFCSAEVLSIVWTGRARNAHASIAGGGPERSSVEQVLMYGAADGTITLWAAETKATIATLRMQPGLPRVIAIACHPAAQRCVVSLRSARRGAGVDMPGAKLQCWSLQQRAKTGELPLDPAPTPVTSLAYNHNGALLISGSEDGIARVFDMRSQTAIMVGAPARAVSSPSLPPRAPSLPLFLSNDNAPPPLSLTLRRRLPHYRPRRESQSWSAHDAALGGVLGVTFRPDDLSVLSAGGDGRVLEWSMRAGNQLVCEHTAAGAGVAGEEQGQGVAEEMTIASPGRSGTGPGGRALGRIDVQFGGDERSFVVAPLPGSAHGGRSAGIFAVGTPGAINVLRMGGGSGDRGDEGSAGGVVASAAWHPSVDCVAIAVDNAVHLRWLLQ
jgi:WD40 repeat protein